MLRPVTWILGAALFCAPLPVGAQDADAPAARPAEPDSATDAPATEAPGEATEAAPPAPEDAASETSSAGEPSPTQEVASERSTTDDATADVAATDDVAADPEPVLDTDEGADADAGDDTTTATAEVEETNAAQTDEAMEDASANDPRAGGECSAFNQLRGLCEGDADAEPAKIWRVFARVLFARLLVKDQDPQNDKYLWWNIGGELDLGVPGLYATAWTGMLQQWEPEPGESSVQATDTTVGVGYRHSVPLDAIGLEGKRMLALHRLTAVIPTSRLSRSQDLYLATDWVSAVRATLVHRFMVGVNLRMRYSFFQYAERGGLQGGMNERFRMEPTLILQQGLYQSEKWGSLLLQGTLGTRYRLQYPSRDDHSSPTAEATFDQWDYTWGLSLTWAPLPYVNATLGLSQDSPILREGVRNAVPFHRDELEVFFSIMGNY